MAKFNPLNFNYELVHEYRSANHYQKKLSTENCRISDILELTHWTPKNVWVIYVDRMNLKQILKGYAISDESYHINLFVGWIKSNQDFRFYMNKICKDPLLIYKLSC